MIIAAIMGQWEMILLWGFIATVAMTTIMHGSQGLGLSRLSLSFLVGTFFTGNHDRAGAFGFLVYVIGGWLFAVIYVLVFVSVNAATWWVGVLLGLLHGLFLLVVVLPLLPAFHPRLAGEHDGPTAARRLEPPGFLGLNYGVQTPAVTMIAHAVYGAILGGFYPIERLVC